MEDRIGEAQLEERKSSRKRKKGDLEDYEIARATDEKLHTTNEGSKEISKGETSKERTMEEKKKKKKRNKEESIENTKASALGIEEETMDDTKKKKKRDKEESRENAKASAHGIEEGNMDNKEKKKRDKEESSENMKASTHGIEEGTMDDTKKKKKRDKEESREKVKASAHGIEEGTMDNKKKKNKRDKEESSENAKTSTNGIDERTTDNKENKKRVKEESRENMKASTHGIEEGTTDDKKKKKRDKEESRENAKASAHGNDGGTMNNKKKERDKEEFRENAKDSPHRIEQRIIKDKKKRRRIEHDACEFAKEIDLQGNKVQRFEVRGTSEPKPVRKGETNERKERKKRKEKRMENDLARNGENSESQGKKRVQFSDQVEVFQIEKEGTRKKEKKDKSKEKQSSVKKESSETEDGMVRGKRYSREEDNLIKQAVSEYIEEHGLGDEGLDIVLNCKKHRKEHPEVMNCWKEIATRLPWRPRESIYFRAQVLHRGRDVRKWSQEEREIVRRHVKLHGRRWKDLAERFGSHRFHVKDLWRRTKMDTFKNGSWSQEEYQQLFDLVNMDLQMRAFGSEEKNTKHGMLRDNIPWESVSDRLTTRHMVQCCMKWYNALVSPMVKEGIWANTDDHTLLERLLQLDACSVEEVDWDDLLENRSGELCRKRWFQMTKHIGENKTKSFQDQVHVLAQRYCPGLFQ